MRVVFDNQSEIKANLLSVGNESATADSIEGIIAPERTIIISDPTSEYSPFNQIGFFSQNEWRGHEIDIYDDTENLVFAGSIKSITEQLEYNSRQLEIVARDALAEMLDFAVEENSKITTLTVNGDHGAGTSTVQLNGTISVTGPAVFYPNANLIPGYLVVSINGNTIQLDRGLEEAITDGQAIILSTPAIKTPAQAIYDALDVAYSTLGFTTMDRVDKASFDMIHNDDIANNRLLWIFVRKEDDITLSKHIAKLAELGDILLTITEAGKLQAIRGMAFSGINPRYTITEKELLTPIQRYYDTDKLLYGYNCLFRNNNQVDVTSNVITDSTIIQKWRMQKVWTPIAAKSNKLIDYNYLYENSATAQYFGDRKLNYYSQGRIRIQAGLKRYFSGTVQEIAPFLFREFLLTAKIDDYDSYENVPIKIVEYEKRHDSYSITMELV